MTIQTCSFVDSSAFLTPVVGLTDAFSELDHDFSWGDNNRSLVSKERFIDALENIDDLDLEAVIAEVNALPPGTYIDLEH